MTRSFGGWCDVMAHDGGSANSPEPTPQRGKRCEFSLSYLYCATTVLCSTVLYHYCTHTHRPFEPVCHFSFPWLPSPRHIISTALRSHTQIELSPEELRKKNGHHRQPRHRRRQDGPRARRATPRLAPGQAGRQTPAETDREGDGPCQFVFPHSNWEKHICACVPPNHRPFPLHL